MASYIQLEATSAAASQPKKVSKVVDSSWAPL